MKHGRVKHRPNESELKLQCLARYLCNLPGDGGSTHEMLNRMQARHGELVAMDLRERVEKERDRRGRR